ncbi:nucleotide-binding universal stress UspA family protein [Roseibium hamelinense]|uniref:Nucleotide-binding universal stress UspA family protein n=1 Tax=Roseibium hamelinense TaxID=150831 RepID=A0A562THH4_9HYPH|nr:universal stress protein [Roseibium hamelinense]MTI45730.1 universal stress protein [Roseibium hamelinense]TWI93087.1 nucleotide-binding universal stress UspA family protein [Roseibium hamelinense]
MYKSILVPIDLGEETSWAKALPTAVAMARTFDAELHLVSVVPDFGRSIVGSYFPKDYEHDALEAAGNALQKFITEHEEKGIKVKGHVAHGTIYEEINAAADKLDCDLIVLSSHRPELKDYLLGPNAARVVRHAKQSVLVVRD